MVDVEGCLVVKTRKSNELFCFDRETGAFKCRIGSKGEGPEEYLDLKDFYYDYEDSCIIVIDAYRNKVLSYNLKGEYLSSSKSPANMFLISGVEKSKDGFLMTSNYLSDGNPHNEYAFTVITPDGKTNSFDRFYPVTVGNSMIAFARHPMTHYGEGLTFEKFLNDTLFRLEAGLIKPYYKLSMKKSFPTKEEIAGLGPYSISDIYKIGSSADLFTGFDRIYETDKYIFLVPTFEDIEGYFWIDKENGQGVHIPSSTRLNPELVRIIEGRTIGDVFFSNEKEIICCTPAVRLWGFLKRFEKNPDIEPFSEKLRPFLENSDPEGNPIVIIYEH